MVNQLKNLNITPIIIDNTSTCEETETPLKKIHQEKSQVIEAGRNLRHKIGFRPEAYEAMPKNFAYKDPDI